MSIKDSGSRTEFSTGAVRDVQALEKGRCDLMPLDVVGELVNNPKCRKGAVVNYIDDFQKESDHEYLYAALWVFIREHQWDVHTMLLEVAIHFAEGCAKYGENNWKLGIPLSRYIDSAVRHYLKYLRGDKDEPHDRAFCWNILCAIWTCKHKPELNDYRQVKNENTCICCGATIPEGQQACPNCLVTVRKENDHVDD